MLMLSLKTEGEHVKRYLREFRDETFRVVNEMPTKEGYAHRLLKEKIDSISAFLHFKFEVKYAHPTCLKCDGFLSKASDSANLICLKCGAKYELKEQVK